MAAMSTVLTEFSDNGNSRTYTRTGHSALNPRLVIQKRKVATSPQGSAEDTIDIISGTLDADGNMLPGRIAFSVTIRRPVLGQATDVTAALAVLRDIVASDEFTSTVNTQNYLKP